MAFVTPNMDLKVWNLLTDAYDHEQQASNLIKIDKHDHGENGGAPIGTAGIADGAITGPKLAGGGFSGSILTNGSVSEAKLQDDSVSARTIQDAAVESQHIEEDLAMLIYQKSGKISSGGGVTGSPTSYTASKDSTGVYTITADGPPGTVFGGSSTAYVVQATIQGSTAGQITVENTSTSAFKVYTFNASGVAADRAFNFTVKQASE